MGFCLTCVRHVSGRQPIGLLRRQRRWARVHDVRFVTTQHAQERITDRYRQKLEEKAKTEGHGDIGSLKDAYKERITDMRKKATVPGATGPLPSQTHSPSSPSSPSQSKPAWNSSAPAAPEQPLDSITPSSPNHKPDGVQTLDSFLDMSKILELPPKEIEALWRLRHARSAATLCASVPTKTFESMVSNARKCPLFILPGLPRTPTGDGAAAVEGGNDAQDGAPIHFLQWTFPSRDTVTVLFTHLAEYKLRGEYSQPHTTITFHTELAGPKGLVLSQGSVIQDRGVSVEEGKWLVMCLQKFYHVGEEMEAKEGSGVGKDLLRQRRGLIEMFNRGDPSFKLEAVVDAAERMG